MEFLGTFNRHIKQTVLLNFKAGLFVCLATCLPTQGVAQEVLPPTNEKTEEISNQFFWGWSVDAGAGIYHPMSYKVDGKLARPLFTLNLERQFTPILSLGFEGNYATPSPHLDLRNYKRLTGSAVLGFNLTRLFSKERLAFQAFEASLRVGAGWVQDLNKEATKKSGEVGHIVAKAGLDFLFNIGQEDRTAVFLRPQIVLGEFPNVNIDNSDIQVLLGVRYRFGAVNPKRKILIPNVIDVTQRVPMPVKQAPAPEQIQPKETLPAQRPTTPVEKIVVQADPAEQMSDSLLKVLAKIKAETDSLKRLLKEKKEERVAPAEHKRFIKTYVIHFGTGQTLVPASESTAVERIAYTLRNNPRTKVVIRGYASSDGNLELNVRIASLRAEDVKRLLITKYGIPEKSIDAAGQSIHTMYTESKSNNKIAICTIIEE